MGHPERRSRLIARLWRGVVAREDGEAYAEYMRGTGLSDYLGANGNQGAYILQRPVEEGVEFVMLSLWTSMEAIRGFAGENVEEAVFYPEDDRFLIEKDLRVRHYDVVLGGPSRYGSS